MWKYFRISICVAALLALVVFTRQIEKDVPKQRAPDVINMLAGTYTPGIVRPDGVPPLIVLDSLLKGSGLDGNGGWEQMAAERHRQNQPGYQQQWQVRFIRMPNIGSASNSWTITRLMAGMAPEFMHAASVPGYWERCDYWFVDLTEYLEGPNPYVPGNKRWADIFNRGVLAFWASSVNGGYYCVPINQVEVGMFYNKTILARCGISDAELPPRNWAHFIDIQRRIKEAGEVPFYFTAGQMTRTTWIYYIFNDMLYAGIYDQLNSQDDPTNSRTWGISSQELIRAHKLGIVRVGSERYWEVWRLIEEWSQYWQPGALGAVEVTPFQRGQVAMTLDSTGFIRGLTRDTKVDFEWGLFAIPILTTESSRFATGALPRGVGGPANMQYCITREPADRKGSVEACVDLLMWITAPQHLGPMVKEEESFLPAVRVADEYIDKRVEALMPVLDRGMIRCKAIDMLGAAGQYEWWAAMQLFLEGTYDKQKVIQAIKKSVEDGIEEELEKYKDIWQWEHDEQGNCTWEITPLDS